MGLCSDLIHTAVELCGAALAIGLDASAASRERTMLFRRAYLCSQSGFWILLTAMVLLSTWARRLAL